MAINLKGTGVALVTPFHKDGSIDFPALDKLVHHVSSGGVDFLVVMGTTAESPTLSTGEKQEVLAAVIKANTKKLPVVLGIGGNNTLEVVHTIRTTNLTGVSALLSVAPYYNKPSQEGLYAHFKAIAASTKLPIILYNVPGRTGSNILPETIIRLAKDCRNINAVKEASGNIVQCMELLRTKPANLVVLSGDDNLILAQMVLGMEGIISVAANSFPKEMTNLINLTIAGKYDKAQKILYQFLPAIDLMFAEGNPSGIKCFLSHQGICQNSLRLPLVPVSEATDKKVAAMLAK